LGHSRGNERGSFLYEAGNIQTIGNFRATAINESAQVVGNNFNNNTPDSCYLYDYDTEILMDLNGCIDPDSGWQPTRVTDINDEGVIIGRGTLNGNEHAMMLVPCEPLTYFHDNDGDSYGDPRETRLACDQPDEYVGAEGVEELIINGGMEGDSNWHDERTPVANERTGARVHRGNFARYLSADETYDAIKPEAFHLINGEIYRVTLWAYGNGSAPLRIVVYRDNQNWFHCRPHGEDPVPPASWTRYSCTFTPSTSGNYDLHVGLGLGGSSGEFFIDDVSITRSVPAISDCNDNSGTIHPNAAESCNGMDDDCDGNIDEGVKRTFYRDVDGDGYGNIQDTTEACAVPYGYVLTGADCDDTRAHRYPDAVEVCNGFDDDCDGEVDEDCIVNELPVADAGNDQQVFEGDTVTLDGSGSMDPDDAIDTWQWVQIEGPPVVLSNEEVARPTFVTPVVTDDHIQLTFRLVVTDLKGALATDEVRVSVAENDISGGWIPDDAITMRTSGGKAIGFKILEGGSLVAIREVANNSLAANSALPEDLIYGPLWLKIRTTNAGENVKLACYFQEPIADTHTAYVLSNTDEWVKLNDQEVLNTDRTEFETDLINGGSMDEDGEDNQYIATTVAIGQDPSREAPENPGTGDSSGSGGGGGGCFIQSMRIDD
jgi:hypothetical protein